jgi:hypothetical protein
MTHELCLDYASITDRLGGPAYLDSSAREHGAIKRARKVKNGATLLRLALMHGPGGLGLRSTVALAEIGGIVAMSDTALWKRMAGADEWLAHLCERELQRLVPADLAGSAGRPSRLVDATWIAGPGESGRRLHLCYDLGAGRITDFALTDEHGGERLDRLAIRAGEIRVGDRGYPTPTGLAAVRAAQADFVVRCAWSSLRLTLADGTLVDRQPLFAAARANGVAEAAVLVDRARRKGWQPLPVRLIVAAIPAEKTTRSQRRARRASQRNQNRTDPRTVEAAAFVMLVTSLPADAYPAERVLALYRLRWQIEIAIKRLKSLIHIDRLPSKDPKVARTWLLAHLLLALVIEDAEHQAADSPP